MKSNSSSNKTHQSPVLVLGASSWLGYVLTNRLVDLNIEVVGTYHSNKVAFPNQVQLIQTEQRDDFYHYVFSKYRPGAVINLLRGEKDLDRAIHNNLIELSETYNTHYVYASSVLALDGYKDCDLTESLEALSVSDYGIFKGECEKDLYDSQIKWSALRFASVQGWVPHKKTRNQNLLEQLAAGKEIQVDEGVIQNRMLASLLIEGMIDIINDEVTGILHFGTVDASDEIDFLKRQATAFELDPSLIESSGSIRNVNLNARMGKLYDLYGEKYRTFEEDTITGLLQLKPLKN